MFPSLDRIVFNDGIIECRLRGVVDYQVYLFFLPSHAFNHGLLVVGKGYLVEWNSIVYCSIRLHKWVMSFYRLRHLMCYLVTIRLKLEIVPQPSEWHYSIISIQSHFISLMSEGNMEKSVQSTKLLKSFQLYKTEL